MRDRCQCRDGPANVRGLSIGCIGSVRDSVLGIARVRHVFSSKTYIVSSGSVWRANARGYCHGPRSLNDSEPTADAKITASVAENACDPQRTAEAPIGRWTDRKLVVDDCCFAPIPASGVYAKGRALQEPRGLTVDDDPLNHPVVD